MQRPEITGRKCPLPIEQRYGVTVQLASEFSGISRSRMYELLADGTIEGIVIRGRRIVIVSSLLRFVGKAPATKKEICVKTAQTGFPAAP
jgi:hypothetical protein